MKLLHLQQVSVVAHTTHNRLRPDLSLDLTPSPQPNQPPPHTRLHVTQPHPPTPSYSRPHPDIPSIHPSIYLYTLAYTQTLTRLHVQL